MDNGSTGQEPHLQIHTGHHMDNLCIQTLISIHILGWIINYSVKSNLILQMNDRRAPILILADDCWLSFFTVPVFKSNILPLKANKSKNRLNHWCNDVNIFKLTKDFFRLIVIKKSTTVCTFNVCVCFVPVLLFSAVESCSLSFSVSSGWSWS